MKTLTEHQINECNQAIKIEADEPDPKNGNASHVYFIDYPAPPGCPAPPGAEGQPAMVRTVLCFQNGPIKEVGTNGITQEVLLAILIDRLRGFQSSPYACRENAIALTKLEEAAQWLHSRTRARVARGVEGTHQV
jgi:hypothetical protein